jgi:hypothetical protein
MKIPAFNKGWLVDYSVDRNRSETLFYLAGLSEEEQKQHNEAIYALGIAAIHKKETPAFLSIHKVIKQLKIKKDLSVETLSLLDKIDSLASQFEDVVLRAETQGINNESISEIERLRMEFQKLQGVELRNRSSTDDLALVYQTIGEETAKVAEKVTQVARVFAVHNRVNLKQASISKVLESTDFYHDFEVESDLKDLNPIRRLSVYRNLQIAFWQLLDLYENDYLPNKKDGRLQGLF